MCRQVVDLRQEPSLVGLDCEMCATRDDDRELLGLCLIDADGEVLVQVVVALGPYPFRQLWLFSSRMPT